MVDHLCACTAFQCKDKTNAQGVRGVKVNARTFRRHQQADKDAQLSSVTERAIQAQQRVLKERDDEISRSLEGMSLADRSEVLVMPGSGRDGTISEVQKAVFLIAEIQDDIASLLDEARSIGTAPSRPDDDLIERALKGLETVQACAAEKQRRLALLTRRSHQPHAILAMRDSTTSDLEAFFQQASLFQTSWEAALSARDTQRKAGLRNGMIEYDSGKVDALLGSVTLILNHCLVGYHFQGALTGASPIIQLVVLMIVACHIILGFSRRGCSWLFSMARYICQTTYFEAIGRSTGLSPYFTGILGGFPRDVRAATEQFHLEGKATIYAACPNCHTTYQPILRHGIPIYPEHCNSHHHGVRCNELLVRPKIIQGFSVNIPIRPYIAFDFKDWMAGLLSRAGYEELMDSAWERMGLGPNGSMSDIFQGSTINQLMGPDGKKHFRFSGGEGAGHYVFSIFFDNFNPLTNKIAGKKLSTGVLLLSCLNLPIEMRQKPENIFLAGIIPGPKEPRLDALNPYVRPVVDSFLEFWTGVHLSRTALYKLGRSIFCAIAVVIGDQPATRKISGFSSYNHEYFCWRDRCNKTQHGHKNFEIKKWEKRTNEGCRRDAENYRDAVDAKKAQSIFDTTGMRWSELLRLPYYDPTSFVVVDPMHNLFLGLIKEHVQVILGSRSRESINTQIVIPDNPLNPLPENKTAKAGVRRLLKLMDEPLDFESEQDEKFDATLKRWITSSILVGSLVYVGRGLGCLPSTIQDNGNNTFPSPQFRKKLSKKDLARALINWVSD